MSNRDLGMHRPIARRDFLNGVGVSVTGSLLSSPWLEAFGTPHPQFAPEKEPGYYPPARTGFRGSHNGSWEVAHELVSGKTWDDMSPQADTDEVYDLIVVGGGISGLAAAYFYRQTAGPRARILVLENHDDFGGHARRNELSYKERSLISAGGTVGVSTPSPYSSVARNLIRDIGIQVERETEFQNPELYPSLNLGSGVFFDKETFGVDRLVARGERSWKEFAALTPLSEVAQKDLVRLYEEKKDYLPGLSSDEKKALLSKTSYRDFLKDLVKVDPQIITYHQKSTHPLFALGIDGVPALDCWGLGYPGFQGMGLDNSGYPGMSLTAKPYENAEQYDYHPPDGGGSVARLLVRALIPAVAPGTTMEDIVSARLDYGRLDEQNSPVRIRLNSTVVRARHNGDPKRAKEVEVTYVRGGKVHRARGRSSVLACWNGVIPHLCPEMPAKQKQALAYGVKVPLVATKVLVRDWKSFYKLGVSGVSCPGSYHTNINLAAPYDIGDYRSPRKPEEPMILSMWRTPCSPGLSSREQHRAGRHDLFSTTFETFEREIRDQLGRVLSDGGFDPARDIEAITVNRWPHGYAYEYNSLWDPVLPEEEQPCVIGRQPFGRFSIANSDAGAYAYIDSAIDMAHRAVSEVLGKP